MPIVQPTTQIDPTNGLIAYVKAIKPYHSKILDVLVEYVVQDNVSTTVLEQVDMTINLNDAGGDVVYTCGFGYVWNPYSQMTGQNIPSAIIDGIESDPVNTFTVSMFIQTPMAAVVTNTKANQLSFVTPYNIVSVNPATYTWTISGQNAANLPPGTTVYVSSNDPTANGRYTVANAVDLITNQTAITTVEPISILALSSGKFNVPLADNDIPYWPAGAAIKFTSSGMLPAPLQPDVKYYYVPTKKIGFFNLSLQRYPSQFEDIIDVTNFGIGDMLVERVEPFVPGELVRISGTGSDGLYTISTIDDLGNSQFKIRVLQRVPMSGGSGGLMTYEGSFGDPYCAVAHAPPLHSETYIYERLVFDFGPDPENPTVNPPPYDVDFI